jgi:hypothetical protein
LRRLEASWEPVSDYVLRDDSLAWPACARSSLPSAIHHQKEFRIFYLAVDTQFHIFLCRDSLDRFQPKPEIRKI